MAQTPTPIQREVRMPMIGRGGPGGGPNRFAPQEKPKNARGTFLRIAKIYMRWKWTILFAVLLTVVTSGVSILIPYYTGYAFNAFNLGVNTVDTALLYHVLLIIVALYAVNWVITTVSGVIMLKISQRLVFVLRSELFDKLQKLPLSFYDTRSHGDTMSRLTNDVDNISITIAQTTTQLVSSILTLSGSFIFMLRLSIPLTLTVLLCVPLVTVLTKTIAGKSRRHFLAQSRSLGALNGIIEESILGLKMIKAFGRGDDIVNEFAKVNTDLRNSAYKANMWSGYMMPLINVINNLTFTLVAIVGGALSVGYAMPVGTVVSFLSYSKQFAFPLNGIAGMFNTIQSALAGAERVFEIMDCAEETPDVPGAVQVQNVSGDVSFKNVNFSYNADTPVLVDISFDVKAGETIALVGETGAGKTTVVNLLTRFYDADSGTVSIDGVPVTDIRRDALRRCFSVVLQDTCLFTGSIMDNIRYSRAEASDAQVIAAAKMAHAHEFIEKLPKGYDTRVSGSTDNLSQGQRQLLAIARAVLCDCPILILDEATSSVDTKTEKDIQKALLGLMRNRTSFLIAHRLSTIRDADRIMVIGSIPDKRGGNILECGNHDQLMQLQGHYYKMVMSQMTGYSNPDDN